MPPPRFWTQATIRRRVCLPRNASGSGDTPAAAAVGADAHRERCCNPRRSSNRRNPPNLIHPPASGAATPAQTGPQLGEAFMRRDCSNPLRFWEERCLSRVLPAIELRSSFGGRPLFSQRFGQLSRSHRESDFARREWSSLQCWRTCSHLFHLEAPPAAP